MLCFQIHHEARLEEEKEKQYVAQAFAGSVKRGSRSKRGSTKPDDWPRRGKGDRNRRDKDTDQERERDRDRDRDKPKEVERQKNFVNFITCSHWWIFSCVNDCADYMTTFTTLAK